MKLVVKPPRSTTTSLGKPVQSAVVPAAAEAVAIGLAAASPKAKHAPMKPQNVATTVPREKLNS